MWGSTVLERLSPVRVLLRFNSRFNQHLSLRLRLLCSNAAASVVGSPETVKDWPEQQDPLHLSPRAYRNVRCLSSLVLMLESAVHTKDYRRAALLCHFRWKDATKLTIDGFNDLTSTRSDFLVRAANAVLFLQGFVIKKYRYPDTCTSSVEKLGEWERAEYNPGYLEWFAKIDIYRFFLDQWLLPNSETLQLALMLHALEAPDQNFVVEQLVRRMAVNGVTLQPQCFTRWATHCNGLSPLPVRKVIGQVRMLVHGYSVRLGLEDVQELISIEYGHRSFVDKLDSFGNVRIIKRLMEANALLSDVEGWNVLLSGYMRTKVIKSIMFVLEDMALVELKPNLGTFKAIIKGLIYMEDYEAYVMAIFYFWREFAKDYLVLTLDIEFLNMLIHCCRKSRHVERAVYFLCVINQCQLTPNLETFRELLVMCYECNQKSYFKTIVKMAHKSLPRHREALDAIAAEYEIQWKAEVDSEMAYTIITGSESRRGTTNGREANVTDIPNTGEDVFSCHADGNIISRDANELIAAGVIKDIVMRHTTAVGVDNVDSDNIIEELIACRAKEDVCAEEELTAKNARNGNTTDKTGRG